MSVFRLVWYVSNNVNNRFRWNIYNGKEHIQCEMNFARERVGDWNKSSISYDNPRINVYSHIHMWYSFACHRKMGWSTLKRHKSQKRYNWSQFISHLHINPLKFSFHDMAKKDLLVDNFFSFCVYLNEYIKYVIYIGVFIRASICHSLW